MTINDGIRLWPLLLSRDEIEALHRIVCVGLSGGTPAANSRLYTKVKNIQKSSFNDTRETINGEAEREPLPQAGALTVA